MKTVRLFTIFWILNGLSLTFITRQIMRIVKEIAHTQCKVTIFQWNNKYLIKLEAGPFEQTFKIDQTDILAEDDLLKIINEDFIDEAMARFADMSRSLADASNQL